MFNCGSTLHCLVGGLIYRPMSVVHEGAAVIAVDTDWLTRTLDWQQHGKDVFSCNIYNDRRGHWIPFHRALQLCQLVPVEMAPSSRSRHPKQQKDNARKLVHIDVEAVPMSWERAGTFAIMVCCCNQYDVCCIMLCACQVCMW